MYGEWKEVLRELYSMEERSFESETVRREYSYVNVQFILICWSPNWNNLKDNNFFDCVSIISFSSRDLPRVISWYLKVTLITKGLSLNRPELARPTR